MKMLTRSTGFTLIELMIVVAVIATLAAVALPGFVVYRDKGRIAQVVGTSEAIRAAMASYAASDLNNTYPATGAITDLVSLSTLVNQNGGTLPATGIFSLDHYHFFDSDGDGVDDTYSMRLVVRGVPTREAGASLLLTPQGIFKCTESGSPC